MKQIESFVGEAQNLSGTEKIKYGLWIDSSGNLYVQIVGNEGAGTFSKGLLFSVSKYASLRDGTKPIGQMNGYDLSGQDWRDSGNNNDVRFLEAALRHLLP